MGTRDRSALPGNASTGKSNQGAQNCVNDLATQISRLMLLVQREDWHGVREVSRELARRAENLGLKSLSSAAQMACEGAAHPAREIRVKRILIQIVGACSAARSRGSRTAAA
jgi:hypothetical protein